jgi:hypothetical protein
MPVMFFAGSVPLRELCLSLAVHLSRANTQRRRATAKNIASILLCASHSETVTGEGSKTASLLPFLPPNIAGSSYTSSLA